MLPILNQSFWRDEAFSALLSQKSIPQLISLTAKDTTPPLHYLLLHYWMLAFGTTEVSIRGLSFLFHVLTAFLVFFIARKLIRSPLVQSLIALATLLNPFLLQYAFEARAYSLLTFLTVVALYFLITKKYLLAGLALALAIFTHNFAIFTLFSIMCWFVYSQRKNLRAAEKSAVLFFTLPVFTLLLWGTVIWHQWTKVAAGFWIKPAVFSLFLNSFQKYTSGDLSYPVQPMLFTFSIFLCFFAFAYWIRREHKEEEGNALQVISFVTLIPTLITYILSALFTPIYDERYLIATVPLLVLLVGYSLVRVALISPKVKTMVIACAAIYLMLLVQSSEQVVSSPTKPSINYAVSQVLSKAQPGDIIIPQQVTNFLETKWYVRQSGKDIPIFAYQPDGKIPFYLGSIMYAPSEVITTIPKGVHIWQINPDGGYQLLQ